MKSSVKLIAFTKPTDEMLSDGIESPRDLIAYMARVSNPDNQLNTETADGLIAYLKRNSHWSPFEMVHAVLEIVCPRDIGRQILRHRSFCFQEFSQRYAEVQNFTIREARLQDKKNRQKSIETDSDELKTWWDDRQSEFLESAADLYRKALEKGVSKECARVVLPEGLTMSRMYMSGSLRSWIHYLQLRIGNGTQKEHTEIARMCLDKLTPVFGSIL